MRSILISWLGDADLRACAEDKQGPVRRAAELERFERIVLLSDRGSGSFKLKDGGRAAPGEFTRWIEARTGSSAELRSVKLNGPTDLETIYRTARATVDELCASRAREPGRLVFNLSSGTPAMSAVWMLLAATYAARLIESSPEVGARWVTLPFDIAAELVPARGPLDRDLDGVSAAALDPSFSGIVHRGVAMRTALATARRVAPTRATVLLEGETGTGKELFARAIHGASPRAEGPFIALNCGGIPSALFESAVFGHERGAFTGAIRAERGAFRDANGGTLFLDEIGELPVGDQTKLLRALQQRQVTPVGGTSAVPVDVRVIAATNRSLASEAREGRFRLDLFYRLAVVSIRIPPLRQREGDLGLLVEHQLDAVNQELAKDAGYRPKKLSPSAKRLLLQHSWPGNVRELEHALLRAALAVSLDAATIDEREMSAALDVDLGTVGVPNPNSALAPLGAGFQLEAELARVERDYLDAALDRAGGNKTRAAQILGLRTRQALDYRLDATARALAGSVATAERTATRPSKGA